MTNRMNVLHIMADQLTAFALAAYGNRICKTPNIDALAARSTVFENAYCNFPVCAPSRASMLTGRLASRLGVYDNACEFPSHAPTVAYYMNALGYHTCLSGKMHFVGPDQLHGYQERLTTDIYPSDFGWTPDWKLAIPVAATGLNLRSVVESGVCTRSLQLDFDDEVAYNAIQRIYDYGRNPQTNPFFLTVSFTHPHNPYVTTQKYWDLYNNLEIDDPRVPGIPDEQLDPHSLRLKKIYRFDEYRIEKEDVRRSRRAYYGMISYIDEQVGKLLETLRSMDLEQQTVVVFTSDHGDMLGERGLWYKWTLFEGATRVPLIVSVPGQRPSRVSDPVSLLDLLPTFVDIGTDPEHAVEPVSAVEGVSLIPCMVHGKALPLGRPVFSEMTADGAIAPCLMVRKGQWKYIFCEEDPPQLYDLAEDEVEMNNLAGRSEVATIEQEMYALVRQNWNLDVLGRDIVESANQRLFIQRARQATSFINPWDYEPRKDPSKQFVRSGGSATVVKGRARYPFVAPKPPDRTE